MAIIRKTLKYGAIGFVGLFIIGSIGAGIEHYNMTPEERQARAAAAAEQAKIDDAIKAAERAEFDRGMALYKAAKECGRSVQRRMNDPDSFELVNYAYTRDGVSITFRGRNAFNAVITSVTTCELPKDQLPTK